MLKPAQHYFLAAHQRHHNRPNFNAPPSSAATATSATDGASLRSRLSAASLWTPLDPSPTPSSAHNTPTRPRRHDDPAPTLRDPLAGSPPVPPGPDDKQARDRTHKHKTNPGTRRQGFDFRWPLADRPANHPLLQRRESVSSTTSRASIIPRFIPFKRRGEDLMEKLAQREKEREAAAEKDRLKGLKERERLKKQLDKEAKKREKEAMQEGLGVDGKKHDMMGRGAKLLRRLSIGSTQAPAWESAKGNSEAGDVQEVMKDDEGTYQLPLPRPVSPFLDTKGFLGASPLKFKGKGGGAAPPWKNMIGRPIPSPTADAAADDKKGYKHYIHAGPDAVLPPHLTPRAPLRPPRHNPVFSKDLFGDLDFITGPPLPHRPPKSPSRRHARITAKSLERAALPEHTPHGLPSRYRPNGVTIFDIYPDEDLDYHPEPPVLANSKIPVTPAAGIQMLAPTRRGGGRNGANNRASRVFAVPEALVALWEYGLDCHSVMTDTS